MTTRHTCNNGDGPSFGRKTAGCPRCDELIAGAAPVKWARSQAAIRSEAIRQHFDGAHHRSGGCGPVCTFGEW